MFRRLIWLVVLSLLISMKFACRTGCLCVGFVEIVGIAPSGPVTPVLLHFFVISSHAFICLLACLCVSEQYKDVPIYGKVSTSTHDTY